VKRDIGSLKKGENPRKNWLRNDNYFEGATTPLNTPPKIHQRIVNPKNEVTRILLLLG
jgi:hypothetical protein